MSSLPKDKKINVSSNQYRSFLKDITTQISARRLRIIKSVTRQQMELYWWLGEQIAKAQELYGWGQSIVEHLSKDLKQYFPNSTYGFSPRNLWDMRRFYLEYKDFPNLRQLVAEIPWGQNLLILSKIKPTEIREYYIKLTKEMGWTRDALRMQIASSAYERHKLPVKQNNFQQVLPQHLAEQANQAMKDIYMLDTLGISQPILEIELEKRIVEKIKDVMLELGYGFAFVGNQYRIACEGNEYFIDLLFYNRRLRSLVALELKKGKFLAEYAGKMNLYLNLLDDFVREPDENPSIGIILCSEHNRFEAEYALRGLNKPMGIAEFHLTKRLPKELKNILPDPKKLEDELLKEMGSFAIEETT